MPAQPCQPALQCISPSQCKGKVTIGRRSCLGCVLEDLAQLDKQNHMAHALSFSSINVLVPSLLAYQDKQILLPTDPQQQNRCYGWELWPQWVSGIGKSFLIYTLKKKCMNMQESVLAMCSQCHIFCLENATNMAPTAISYLL